MTMRIGLIDIETAPHVAYVWGPRNAYIRPGNIRESGYTMCFAFKWLGNRAVTFKSVHHDGHDDMVQTAWDLLNESDAVVHYNGSKFDIPTLNADFIAAGMPPPDPYKEIDLLKVSRRRFRRYSHKLDEVAKWLKLGRKVEHKGLALWTECMDGVDRAWRVMRRYNCQDVRLLEDIYRELLPWIKDHPNHALYTDAGRPTCPNCGSARVIKKGFSYSKTRLYQRFRCTDCGAPIRGRHTVSPPEHKAAVLVQE